MINEVLFGIRVVKFCAWEPHFTAKVDVLRKAELDSLKKRKYLDAMCVYFWATTPVLISIITFATYILLGNRLTAAKVRFISRESSLEICFVRMSISLPSCSSPSAFLCLSRSFGLCLSDSQSPFIFHLSVYLRIENIIFFLNMQYQLL